MDTVQKSWFKANGIDNFVTAVCSLPVQLAKVKSIADLSSIKLESDFSFKWIEVNHAELWKTVQEKEGVRYEKLL